MNKMNELFVETINKALTAADVMSDVNRKPTAYASIALALATYLKGEQQPVAQAPIEELKGMNDDELIKAFNQTPLELINDEETAEPAQAPVEEPKADAWTLQYDENGIPFLNTEDYEHKERVLAYENALTSEIEAKKKAIEQEKGRAVLNEPAEQVAQAPQAPANAAPAEQEVDPRLIEAIENYKVCFGYDENPELLDSLVFGFTSGVIKKLDDLTPDLYVGFTGFVMDENIKAGEYIKSVAEAEAAWINIDSVVAEVWQDEERTYENTINDGNVVWFAGYLKEYVARAYLNSYIESWGEQKILKLFKEFSEDGSVTFDDLTSENIIQFVDYLSTTQAA